MRCLRRYLFIGACPYGSGFPFSCEDCIFPEMGEIAERLWGSTIKYIILLTASFLYDILFHTCDMAYGKGIWKTEGYFVLW